MHRISACAVVLIIVVVGCSSVEPTPIPLFTQSPIRAPSTFGSPLPRSSVDRSLLAGRILYHSNDSGDFDIYVMDVSKGDVRQLVSGPGNDVDAIWSPDGNRIAFSSDRDENHEIYLLNIDGGDLQQLTSDPASDWGPTWSAEGNYIAFASDRNGKMHLFVMDSDGTNQHPLEPESETAGWAPAWSPVRNEIVFVSDRDGDSDLYLVQLESSSVIPLTFNDRQDERPAWSPDGDQIVYMGAKENTSLFDPDEIYIIPRLGGEPRQLTDDLVGDILPTWSPDGEWVAFSSSQGDSWNIHLAPVSGIGDRFQLTNNSAWNRGACWGP
jgi:Tol biopolymer transport system component